MLFPLDYQITLITLEEIFEKNQESFVVDWRIFEKILRQCNDLIYKTEVRRRSTT